MANQKNENPSITINGGIYIHNIEHVEHLHAGQDNSSETSNTQINSIDSHNAASHLPPELATPEAVRLLDLAKENGWLDDQYQPQLPTKVQIALLAGRINELLWDTNRWVVFEKFWGQRKMVDLFRNGLESEKQQDFWNSLTDRLK